MFDPLEETIKHDEATPVKEKVTKGIVIVVLAIVLFGGLYALVRMAG